ncbi:MAG: hypothetical protein ACYDDI_01010 [Candidatus Acidiferrales bacterium]
MSRAKAVKLLLPELSNEEMALVLKILRMNIAQADLKSLRNLEKQCFALARRASRFIYLDRTTWGESAEWKSETFRKVWSSHREMFSSGLRKARRPDDERLRPFAMMTAIGDTLAFDAIIAFGPQKLGRFVVQEVEEFLYWLEMRMVANHQVWLFVECERCKKWAVRKRARRENRYCSQTCTLAANAERAKEQAAMSGSYVGQIRRIKRRSLGRRFVRRRFRNKQ